MKGFYGCILLWCITLFSASAQTITSAQDGDWNVGATWVGGTVPTSANSTLVQIANGHNIAIPSGFSATAVSISMAGVTTTTDLTIASGGDLTFTGTLTLGSGPTTRGRLFINGELNVEEGAVMAGGVASAGRVVVGGTGTYRHNYTTSPGTIYTATWNTGSTLEIAGYTSNVSVPAGLGQAFSNFTWSCENQENDIYLNGSLVTVNGNLTLEEPLGLVFGFTTNTNYTLTIGQDLIVAQDAFLDLTGGSGNATVNLRGNFVMNADDGVGNYGSGTAGIVFTGPSPQTFTNQFIVSSTINFTIQNGSRLNIPDGSFINGPGQFTLQAGATMGVGSVDGLMTGASAGNIRVSGNRNYTANGNIVYIGSTAQNLGDEWGATGALNGIAVNLEIANTNSAGVTNNVIGSTSLVGNLTLTSNPFHIGNSNTLIVQSNFNGNGGTIGGLTSSNLTFSGSGTVTGNLNFASGARDLNNFTIDRSGTLVLGTDLTIAGILSLASTGNLQFNGQTLTVNGNITQGGSGALISNSSSNLTIGGTGALSALPFTGSSALNNVSLGRTTGGAYTWNSSVVIHGTIDLSSGNLTHSSGLTMNAGSTFSRSTGTQLLSNAPNASGNYNVTYNGTMTTGLELPAANLLNLTKAGVGDVTLDKSILINGDLSITNGGLNASTFNVDMAGDDFLVNGGTFTINAANTVTFSRNGTTTLAGSTIAGTQFGNVVIGATTTVSAPNSNINVSGAWTNAGNFTANSGTVTFNGTTQNLDPNGQPFNNVTFNGSGTKTLLGALDANGTLTINSGSTLTVGADNPINVGGTWTNNGTFLANGGTVTFDGTAQTITSNGQPFFNLALDNSGTKTLGGALDVNGAITIASGVTLDASASAFNINVAGNWTNGGTFNGRAGTAATVTFDGNSSIFGSATSFNHVTITGTLTAASATSNVAGNWTITGGTFIHNGGNIHFNGTTAQNISSLGQAFNNVNFSNGAGNPKTLLGPLNVNGSLNLSSGTLDVGANHQVTVAVDFTATGGSSLVAASGLFVFNGASAQVITSGGKVFNNVQLTGAGAKSLVGAFDANGNMTIASTLSAGANPINVGGNWNATGGTVTTTGLTTFDGTNQNINPAGSSFGSVSIAGGSGTKTLQNALDANGDLTIGTGTTLDVSTSNFAITTGGNWDSGSGTLIPRAGTVTLDGTAQNITTGTSNFFNITLAGSGTKTLLDALDVNSNLLISSGTTLNVGTGNNNIELAANWTNNGAFVAGTGTVILDGGGAQAIGGTTVANFNNITVSKASGVATISSAQNLINALTMTGGTLNANGMLTLISNASGDARIAEITGGSITGGVIAQRFLPIATTPPSGGVYRYFASPVTNAFVSDLKDDFPITGNFSDPSTQAQWPGLFVTSSAINMFFYNEAHLPTTTLEDRYESYPLQGTSSTTSSLVNGRGYSARVRQTTPITLDLPGTPQQGPVIVNLTAQSAGGNDGWNLIGNPYAAPINWDNVTIPAQVNAQIAIKDNANNGGLGVGQYVYYTQGSPGTGIPVSYTGNIASGQAFFARATANTSITFQENDKQAISNPTFIRQGSLEDILRITVTGNEHQDEMVVRFADNATDKADNAFDAYKFTNDFINLSSFSSDGVRLAINVMSGFSCNREVALDLTNVTPGAYTFAFSQFESFKSDITIKLYDTFTGSTFEISEANPVYPFVITTDEKTFGKDRFKVFFSYPSVRTNLAMASEDICNGSNATIRIQNSQAGIKYFSTIEGKVVSAEVPGDGDEIELTIPGNNLAGDESKIVVMAARAGCGPVPMDSPIVIKTGGFYKATSLGDNKSCGEGSVSLVVEGAPDGGSYRWYETLQSTSPIEGQQDAEFNTPVLNKTKTYYASVVTPGGCEGERVAVSAEVVYIEPVSITVNEQLLTSSYATGNQWFFNGEIVSGATGSTMEVTETGLYEVETVVNGCSTRSAREMVVLSTENLYGKGFEFYPNPVDNLLRIELPDSGPATGYIQSAVGKSIGQIKFARTENKTTGEFDFSGQASGLYVVRIFQDNKIISHKVIKR